MSILQSGRERKRQVPQRQSRSGQLYNISYETGGKWFLPGIFPVEENRGKW
ncbi:hypothetical protein HMPREF1548_03239 [Clostridium sp. KLE 1755]|nr:hypothetical protein HMPREF1548_03239 [Clostridium sp. KLE 1755]